MAFNINRFQKKYKEVVAENAELKARVDGWAVTKAAEIGAAVLAAVTPLRNQASGLKHELADRERRSIAHDVVRGQLVAKVDELEYQAAAHRAVIAGLEKRHLDLEAELAATQPAIAAAEQKAQDAIDLLKRHEESMSAKRRAELAALENRKLLAAAVPSPRRG
ncbi:MAG: hypothetical protein EPN91_00445 [Salinibacterium sp.]|nr:MAG: hypothetical protein EPN91_00445 [Salinibacterium sp.]